MPKNLKYLFPEPIFTTESLPFFLAMSKTPFILLNYKNAFYLNLRYLYINNQSKNR